MKRKENEGCLQLLLSLFLLLCSVNIYFPINAVILNSHKRFFHSLKDSKNDRGLAFCKFAGRNPQVFQKTVKTFNNQQNSLSNCYTKKSNLLHSSNFKGKSALNSLSSTHSSLGGGGVHTVDGDKVDGVSVKEYEVERTLFQSLHMATSEEMYRDPAVCVIGEDVGHYGGSYQVTKDLHFRYGNFRLFDTPICENTFTGMAIGASMNGLRCILEGMNMGFLLLAFNQISNNAGMIRYTSGGNFEIPLVIRGPGGIGKQLGPEHSQRIEAYLMAVPGIKIVSCSTPYNARGLLKSAIRDNNPVVFFEHVLTYNIKQKIPLLPYTLPLDKAEVVCEGSDITLLCYGKLRHVALEAVERLKRAKIYCELIDLISLKPLDLNTIYDSLKKTKKCIILDESNMVGGIAGEIYAQIMENMGSLLDIAPIRLCSSDVPTPYNKFLEEATIVNAHDVVNSVLCALAKKR